RRRHRRYSGDAIFLDELPIVRDILSITRAHDGRDDHARTGSHCGKGASDKATDVEHRRIVQADVPKRVPLEKLTGPMTIREAPVRKLDDLRRAGRAARMNVGRDVVSSNFE